MSTFRKYPPGKLPVKPSPGEITIFADHLGSINALDGTSGQQSALLPSKADQATAEAGTNDTAYMTPLKTAQAIVKRTSLGGVPAMEVSGAGTPEVNGVYTLRGTENGKPYYNKVGAPNDPYINSIFWNGAGWLIEQGATVFYNAFQNVATPDLVTSWDVSTNGTPPAPTVTATTYYEPISNNQLLFADGAGGVKSGPDVGEVGEQLLGAESNDQARFIVAAVGLYGDETIAGNKTFTGNIIVPDATADMHALNRGPFERIYGSRVETVVLWERTVASLSGDGTSATLVLNSAPSIDPTGKLIALVNCNPAAWNGVYEVSAWDGSTGLTLVTDKTYTYSSGGRVARWLPFAKVTASASATMNGLMEVVGIGNGLYGASHCGRFFANSSGSAIYGVAIADVSALQSDTVFSHSDLTSGSGTNAHAISSAIIAGVGYYGMFRRIYNGTSNATVNQITWCWRGLRTNANITLAVATEY